MFFKKIESEGLAHFSYMVGDKSDAAVIDPRRDIDIYLEEAQKAGVKIKYIFETHRNEDYIIGSRALAKMTGAEIYHSDGQLNYEYKNDVEDGKKYKIGRLNIEAMHTPGHTKGSHSYILNDYDDEPWMIFTGDILFAGDVGRIDFYGEENIPKIAGLLYESLYNKIAPLGDGVIICPAHGAGSVCGSQIADKEFTTIGIEKKSNPYYQYQNKEDFMYNVGKMEAQPQYFRDMEAANLISPDSTEIPFVSALTPEEFAAVAAEENTVIIDTRSDSDYATSHIENSLYLWEQILASFIGWFLDVKTNILIVNEGDYPDKIVRTLYRMGYENVKGYLSRGMLSWNMAGKINVSTSTVGVHKLCDILDENNEEEYTLLDIRTEEEKEDEGYIKGSLEIPLTELEADLENYVSQLDNGKDIYIFCGSGMRSMTAASLLEKKMNTRVSVVIGGLSGWSSTSCPIKSN
jgi:hydroxyacylglutathione hydrolase